MSIDKMLERALSRRHCDKTSTHLVIPDSHARPEHNNDRFDWLGKLIADLKPDVVVDIGDLADMPSLSAYDGSRAVGGGGGKRSFENRRYLSDVEAAIDARSRITKYVEADNERHRKTKHHSRQYFPTLIACEGNHDERIRRVSSWIPELTGFVDIANLRVEQMGWAFHPLTTPAVVDGVHYAHYFASGVMGKPIGGENAALAAVKKLHCSVVFGHTHLFSHGTQTLPNGKRINGVNVGVYDDGDHDYAGAANKMWWRGLVLLTQVNDGDFDVVQLSLDWVRNTYGG